MKKIKFLICYNKYELKINISYWGKNKILTSQDLDFKLGFTYYLCVTDNKGSVLSIGIKFLFTYKN